MRRIRQGTSSNASNVSDENVNVNVIDTPNLANENVQHKPIEMMGIMYLIHLMHHFNSMSLMIKMYIIKMKMFNIHELK